MTKPRLTPGHRSWADLIWILSQHFHVVVQINCLFFCYSWSLTTPIIWDSVMRLNSSCSSCRSIFTSRSTSDTSKGLSWSKGKIHFFRFSINLKSIKGCCYSHAERKKNTEGVERQVASYPASVLDKLTREVWAIPQNQRWNWKGQSHVMDLLLMTCMFSSRPKKRKGPFFSFFRCSHGFIKQKVYFSGFMRTILHLLLAGMTKISS